MIVWFIIMAVVIALIVVLVRLGVEVAADYLFDNGKKATSIEFDLTKADQDVTTMEARKTPTRSKNDMQNLHKALLRNRRQGNERFLWHGSYYYTGLENLTHGKPYIRGVIKE